MKFAAQWRLPVFTGVIVAWLIGGAAYPSGNDSDEDARVRQSRPANGAQEMRMQARRVVLPLYIKSETQPAAALHINHIYQGHQTYGFMRIGALPLIIVEDAYLEIQNADGILPILSDVGRLVKTWSKAKSHPIEIRHFTLSSRSAAPVLQAVVLQIAADDRFTLRQGSVTLPDSGTFAFKKAVITSSGPWAGELVCQTERGEITTSLRSILNPQSQSKNP